MVAYMYNYMYNYMYTYMSIYVYMVPPPKRNYVFRNFANPSTYFLKDNLHQQECR